jgi:hypothetical protein
MWQRIDQHMNFLKVDELNSVKLEVELSDGVVIGEKIQEWPYLIGWSQNKEKQISELLPVYRVLAEHSFESRFRRHSNQVSELGYFTYLGAKGAKFYPRWGLQLSNGARLAFSEYRLLKGPYTLTLEEKTTKDVRGFFKRSLGLVSEIEIKTFVDQDVFFALLNHYYGLRWS